MPYSKIVQELRVRVPERGLRLAGPNVLWYGWEKEKFRDIGAIMVSRWYCQGKREVRKWIEPWKPEVIVLDNTLKRIFLLTEFSEQGLMNYLGCRVQSRGIIETEGAYGPWEVYRIYWDVPAIRLPSPKPTLSPTSIENE